MENSAIENERQKFVLETLNQRIRGFALTRLGCTVLASTTERLNRNSHRRFSIKKGFLKISQNSQESICVTVSL